MQYYQAGPLSLVRPKQETAGNFAFDNGRRNTLVRAMTMVELLITMVIIAVLASIVLPRFPVYLEKARRKEALHMMSQIRQAEQAYMTEFTNYTSKMSLLPWDVPTQSKNYNYKVGGGAQGQIQAVRISSGVAEWQMSSKTGKVTYMP